MRKPCLMPRDSRSTVQITSTVSTKDVIRTIANGQPIELPNNGVSGAYDFDGEDPDFEKPLIQEAENKIDQVMRYREYKDGNAHSNQSDQLAE